MASNLTFSTNICLIRKANFSRVVFVLSLELQGQTFFFKINLFIYLFIFGCIGSSLLRVVVASRDYSLLQVRGLLIVVASLVAEYGP